MSISDSHSLLLDHQGQVYSCGSNPHGQLGRPSTTVWSCPKPQRIETLQGVIQVKAIGACSVFLTRDGQVYMCGHNDYRQLGFDQVGDRYVPVLIDALAHVKVIQFYSCGIYNLFVTDQRRVYGCGQSYLFPVPMLDYTDRFYQV